MSNDLELLSRSYVDQVQELDTAQSGLLTLTSLAGSDGVQLDGLGEIIGVEREGLSDDDYRSLLRAYVQINISAGTIGNILEAARLAGNLSPTGGSVILTEGSTAEFLVEIPDALPSGRGNIVAEAVYQAHAGGVYAVTQFHEVEPVFAFDGYGSSAFDGGYYLISALRNRSGRESEIL